MADPSRQFSGKTKIAYDSIFRMLIESIGENTPIRENALTLFAAISGISYDLDLMHLRRADYEP